MHYKLKVTLVSIVVLICMTTSAGQNTSGTPADNRKLINVEKIYLDLHKLSESEKNEDTDKIREKIRQRLIKSKRFIVVDSLEQADAILSGTIGLYKHDLGPESVDTQGVIRTRSPKSSIYDSDDIYLGYGDVKLVDSKTREMIWSYEYKPAIFGNPLDSVAKNVVNHLLDDAKKIGKKSK